MKSEGWPSLAEGGGLENRFSERRRGFESLSLRQNFAEQKFWRDLTLPRRRRGGSARRDLALRRRWRGGYASTFDYVLCLHSVDKAKTRTYTGVTEDVNKRLAEHNAGRVKSSQPYRPYEVVHIDSFETLSEARQKEKYYKSTTGRRRIREMIFEA